MFPKPGEEKNLQNQPQKMMMFLSEKCVHLTNGGDDCSTEKESIGWIPSAGII